MSETPTDCSILYSHHRRDPPDWQLQDQGDEQRIGRSDAYGQQPEPNGRTVLHRQRPQDHKLELALCSPHEASLLSDGALHGLAVSLSDADSAHR